MKVRDMSLCVIDTCEQLGRAFVRHLRCSSGHADKLAVDKFVVLLMSFPALVEAIDDFEDLPAAARTSTSLDVLRLHAQGHMPIVVVAAECTVMADRGTSERCIRSLTRMSG